MINQVPFGKLAKSSAKSSKSAKGIKFKATKKAKMSKGDDEMDAKAKKMDTSKSEKRSVHHAIESIKFTKGILAKVAKSA